MENIFAVYKPKGMTSHDVVDIVRKKTNVKRVGHGGTLDPLAEGVLVIAVGRENTKKLDEFVKGEKEYVAEIKLGYESTTDDEEGEKTLRQAHDKQNPNKKAVEQAVKKFIGKILQTPPLYSSVKLQGKPAHRRIRKGQEVKLEPREVEIKNIEILEYIYPVIKIKVQTGPGVYIRSLARDIGKELKTGGYLKSLIRTRVANFLLENSITVEELKLNP